MRVTDTVCASEGVGQNKIALTLDLSMWEVRLTVCGLSVGYDQKRCTCDCVGCGFVPPIFICDIPNNDQHRLHV